MKLPRDLSGESLTKALERLGYSIAPPLQQPSLTAVAQKPHHLNSAIIPTME
jgi:hypothetical protein